MQFINGGIVVEENINNNIEKSSVILDLCVKDDGFEFASSVTSALSEAENELLEIQEKITESTETIQKLTPECDKVEFTIFKWWESWIKPFIYVLIFIATAGLIAGYCFIKDDEGMIAFVVSISYAFVLFLVTIPINKIDGYTAEKLYEREGFYLTLKRLRDVTNSTIEKVDKKNLSELIEHILAFQVFTGRSENMVEQRLQGKKVPVYVKEKGFTYSLKMQELEMKILRLHNEGGNKKEL